MQESLSAVTEDVLSKKRGRKAVKEMAYRYSFFSHDQGR
jgi:hypothetical protein